MKKDLFKIFIVLLLFGLSDGIFYNFQELWMLTNNLSIKTIGIVFSLCSLLTVSTIFLCSNFINKSKIKKFVSILLLFKCFVILTLFFLNASGLNILIKFLIMLDFVIDTEIIACVYPLLALVNKNNKMYAKKDLIYDASYYVGSIITSFLLGKFLISVVIDYNFYYLISGLLLIIAFLILTPIDFKEYIKKDNKKEKKSHTNVLEIIKKDKISRIYLLVVIINQLSFRSILGLQMTILTNNLNFTPQVASNIIIFTGIIGVLFGIVVLAKLTVKNDYINISIKFLSRVIIYLFAFILNANYLYFLSFIVVLLTSPAYTHVSEAPYINRISLDNQLSFCNAKEMICYFGRSIGTYLCGIAIIVSIRLNFIFAFVFGLMELLLRYYLVHLLKKEEKR